MFFGGQKSIWAIEFGGAGNNMAIAEIGSRTIEYFEIGEIGIGMKGLPMRIFLIAMHGKKYCNE